MLFRQNLRRRHQRHVETAFQRHQRRARGHHGFAGPDIALQQPPHRMRAAHVRADFAEHVRLRAGELEAEPRQKRFHQTVVAAARQRARFGLEIPPAKLHFALQGDEFIQRQPPPRDFHIGQFFGKMNHADRVGARRQVWSSAFRRSRPLKPELQTPARRSAIQIFPACARSIRAASVAAGLR